jgi:3-hydroxyisobutyrate dehydrogenase
MSAVEKKVGFVGLGAMGWPMASNLVKNGLEVAVHDARIEESRRFASEVGGTAAVSPRALGESADIVVTMLPTSKIVEKALFDPGGIAETLRSGSIVVDMSSGVPTATAEIANRLQGQGISMLDAPVSGGVKKAVSGELSIMVGGDHEVMEQVKSVLSAMGKSITWAGPIGCGQAMKALNNLVSAGGFLIGVEALLIGKKFGLAPDVMVDILNASTGMNNSTQVKFKQYVLSGSYAAGFALDLMVKDIGIALDVAKDLDVEAPFSTLCQQIWSGAQAELGPGHDHTEVAKYSAKIAGMDLP